MNEKTTSTALPATASKPRYEILDGLRGVAAVYIVIYHLCEGCGIMLGHGYLGVDFFYALSGFVIGYAYDNRWDKMTTGSFLKRRLIRLHPMVLFSMVLGAALFYFGQSDFFPLIAGTPWWKVALLFLYCSLMLPMPNSWDIRGWQDTNSFNGNVWSLQWEYLVNLLYALVLRRLPTIALGALTLVCALGTIDLTLNLDVFSVFSAGRDAGAYSVNGGWALTADQLYIGAVRVLYPFLAGLFLSRVKTLLRVPAGFWTCSLFLLALLLVPPLAGFANGLYEMLVILVAIPLLVSMGAGSPLAGKRTSSVCLFLGEISYPIYLVHMPLVYAHMAWVSNNPDAPTGTVVFLAAGVFVLSILLAYAALKLYDIPLRKWLSRK